ncbi:Ribonuclease H-like superfamily [Arabidopsis suecica]|uniref:Ribonuclease H-like superfamily n=1 Tax=Arabidopsis suecica TaxID=45249 RepID=A0A8T1ZYG1_ARASU|nr:Ribonuclease H-like superfamily [Arabidopsis suecica]
MSLNSTAESSLIFNGSGPKTSVISLNLSKITKLTSANYLTWKLQVRATLEGHELHPFIEERTVSEPTVTNNNVSATNPLFVIWKRQDRLLYSALLGTLTLPVQALVARTTTSLELWNSLAKTFGQASRERIKALKSQLKHTTKGTQSVEAYMQSIITKSDQLALIGAPVPHEDLLDIITEAYSSRKCIAHHRPLMPQSLPVTANATHYQPQSSMRGNYHGSSSARGNYRGGRGYQGKCQLCGTFGHSSRRCSQLASSMMMTHQSTAPPTTPADSAPWLLDSAASHHIASDLSTLSLHSPYTGSVEVLIGDGNGLGITHTGSTNLSSGSRSLHFNNVRDLNTGAQILSGKAKQGVYEWPSNSSPSSLISAHSAITTLYSDNGGEYIALATLLVISGITHLTTPPHTPEHNGMAERRHRHIVDTGLALLTHAGIAQTYWTYSFMAAVYLINRLPTPTLANLSPFQLLFQVDPNYQKLRTFGCLCYSWLRPYGQNKFSPKSTPCVFLGYSLTQSAYICLDVSTSHIYISRHVEFFEYVFPFSQLACNTLSFSSESSSPSHPIASFAPTFSRPLTTPSTPVTNPSPAAPTIAPTIAPLSSNGLTTDTHIVLDHNQEEPPPNTHPMTTRAKNNIHKPNPKYGLTVQLGELEPTSHSQALKDEKWRRSMRFHQRPGIDFSDTFSHVIKHASIRLVLGIDVARGWPLRQLDVNNAFLQGNLKDEVYMKQPVGFEDREDPHYVCRLRKAIYGLKQAPRAWYNELRLFLRQLGFTNSLGDASLFVFHKASVLIYILVYVDDIVVTWSGVKEVNSTIQALFDRFSLKDHGELSYFLGMEATRTSSGLSLTQTKYITDLVIRTKMADAKPVTTPMSSATSLTATNRVKLSDPTSYRATVGSLQYLSLTRPDISFAVNRLSQFMHAPTSVHEEAMKRVLRYLPGTVTKGIFFSASTPLNLHAYSDADWAGDHDDYSSTGAYIVYLGKQPISWASRKLKGVARSSTEAEYQALTAAASEVKWLSSLLVELGIKSITTLTIFCDNIGATYLSANPVFHSRMKHLALDYHFVREQVQARTLRVSHICSADQLADALTKPLPRARFTDLAVKIGLRGRSSS